MPNKFHSLLASKTKKSFLSNLNLSESEDKQLLADAKEIKTALIRGFQILREQIKTQNIEYEIPIPKFAIQGSYIYGTLNSPAFPPEQQVDIDLGVYLPFSALGNGDQPKTATEYYFQAIANILKAHIKTFRNGQWTLPSEEDQKPTCVRVILNEKTHIDLPLYAVPEGELNRITEDKVFTSKAMKSETGMFLLDSDDFRMEAQILEAVDPSVIHMAHRTEGWKPSDALVIRDWVKGQFKEMGSMVRPVNRFLKAWRDQVWRNGGEPSSILLLAHVLKSFPRNTDNLTHCDALEAVINELPYVFDRPLLVPCPTTIDRNAKEDLCERIKLEKKAEYLAEFQNLKDRYFQAKQATPVSANNILIVLFGVRMPNDPSRIEVVIDTPPQVKTVLSATPEVKPLRTTERSNSG